MDFGNNVGKGENAGVQHFLLFPKSFQERSVLGLLNSRLSGAELKHFEDSLIELGINFFSLFLTMIENIVGKEENARHQHFLLSLQCLQKPFFHIVAKTSYGFVKGQ